MATSICNSERITSHKPSTSLTSFNNTSHSILDISFLITNLFTRFGFHAFRDFLEEAKNTVSRYFFKCNDMIVNYKNMWEKYILGSIQSSDFGNCISWYMILSFPFTSFRSVNTIFKFSITAKIFFRYYLCSAICIMFVGYFFLYSSNTVQPRAFKMWHIMPHVIT